MNERKTEDFIDWLEEKGYIVTKSGNHFVPQDLVEHGRRLAREYDGVEYGAKVVDGVPHINGAAAEKCEKEGCYHTLMNGAVLDYLCPVCCSHLGRGGICLNACHLSPASRRRFNEKMRVAQGWKTS